MNILGIGSRIIHNEFGKGVVTNVTSKDYWVTFVDNGLETINIDSDFDVIEACEEDVDTISFADVESSLVH
ncbi:MAG: hypothetical protein ACJAR4_001332, partial [Psychroserpens sp.]